MLVSNIGLAMNTHYCGGHAMDSSFSLGLHDLDCGMPNMDEVLEVDLSNEIQFKASACCDTEHQILQLDEDIELQSAAKEINPIFLVSFANSLIQPLVFTETFISENAFDPSPLPDKDIQVLYQTFLL